MTPTVSNATSVLVTILEVESVILLLALIFLLIAAGVYVWRNRI